MELVRLDDLTWYVLYHYGNLMTTQEEMLYYRLQPLMKMQNASLQKKCGSDEGYKPADAQLTKRFKEENPVRVLREISDRIIRDHGSDIIINRCPKCERLVATPRAKQCKTCGHDWH